MTTDLLYSKLKLLNERLWENRAPRPNIDAWLGNFAAATTPSETLHALFLLAQFMYFGDIELREMLRSLFRDKFRYPLVQEIRKNNGNTTDKTFIDGEFASILSQTRFLGMGNPAESGTHLLYFFRQENNLPKKAFWQSLEIFDRPMTDVSVAFANASVSRLVFIDDFCASGDQAVMYSNRLLRAVRDVATRTGRSVRTHYLVLIATEHGIGEVKGKTLFDDVDAVFTLDDTYKCFAPTSRYFKGCPADIVQAFAKEVAEHYGRILHPTHPLGYKDAQLLLGFHHNIPDNTLPIVWYAEPDHAEWRPIFRRYQKIYG